jgi:hypothetical protein
MIKRIWMNPPNVYDVTSPKSHKTKSTTKIVHSMPSSFLFISSPFDLDHTLGTVGGTAPWQETNPCYPREDYIRR